MRLEKLCLGILAITLGFLSYVQADFYVANNGSDLNPGSLQQPWKTIQHAAQKAVPGSTVYIRQGIYYEGISIAVSGKAGSYIVFRNYEKETVVVDGKGVGEENLLLIDGKSYIKVIGIHFTNLVKNYAKGIHIANGAHHIEIRDNKISHIHFSINATDPATPDTNAQPLIVFGSNSVQAITDLVIDNNEIFNCRTGYSEALAVNGNVENFQVTNNRVHDITNIGIDLVGHEGTCPDPAKDQARYGIIRGNLAYNCVSSYATSGGIYVDGARNITIERNRVHHCGWGIEVGCENIGKVAENIVVRNNVLYFNRDAGISIGGFDFPNLSGKVVNCKLFGNTCYQNDQKQNGNGEITVWYGTEKSTIQGNIFYCSTQNILLNSQGENMGDNRLDYNLWYGPQNTGVFTWNKATYSNFALYQKGSGQDIHSLFASPLFVSLDATNPNLHLQATSPARNHGDPYYLPATGEQDIDGEKRVAGSAIDIGADEVQQ